MRAVEKMYGRWGNYIPTDIRKQFEDDCLEAEKQVEELKDSREKDYTDLDRAVMQRFADKQIKELKEMGRVMITGYANGLSDIAIAKAWKLFDYEHNKH